jgi:hypothetical protein
MRAHGGAPSLAAVCVLLLLPLPPTLAVHAGDARHSDDAATPVAADTDTDARLLQTVDPVAYTPMATDIRVEGRFRSGTVPGFPTAIEFDYAGVAITLRVRSVRTRLRRNSCGAWFAHRSDVSRDAADALPSQFSGITRLEVVLVTKSINSFQVS